MKLVHMFRIPPQIDSGSNFLSILRVLYFLEKGGGTPYLLEKGGGISHLGRQIMKVPKSEGVGMEEFFNDFSTSKRKYFRALPWELRDLPLIKRRLVHKITKSDWMP